MYRDHSSTFLSRTIDDLVNALNVSDDLKPELKRALYKRVRRTVWGEIKPETANPSMLAKALDEIVEARGVRIYGVTEKRADEDLLSKDYDSLNPIEQAQAYAAARRKFGLPPQ